MMVTQKEQPSLLFLPQMHAHALSKSYGMPTRVSMSHRSPLEFHEVIPGSQALPTHHFSSALSAL